MPRSPRAFRSALSLSSAALVVLLATTGCSGGSSDGDEPRAASAAEAQVAITALVDDGVAHVAEGEHEEARTSFGQALDLDPQHVPALYNLGYLAQLDDDPDTAVDLYTTVLDLEQDYTPALYNLGILTEQGDLPGAVALYRRVVTLSPDHARAHVRLGFALRHLGQRAQGRLMLEQGIALDPALAEAESPVYG